MRSGYTVLHPTLWRTCRALMNERRLACLAAVFDTPGLSVGEAAEAARVPENQASVNLRVLQSRGLLAARRDGRWIRYFPDADPLVVHAAKVLEAVRREFKGGTGRRVARMMRTLRAFTHSRRLTILKKLMLVREATCEEIVADTRISQPAVSRHLETMRGAGIVLVMENGAWALAERNKLSALARTIIDVIENG